MHKSHPSFRTYLITGLCLALFSFNGLALGLDELTPTSSDNPQQTEFKLRAKKVLKVMDQWARSWAQLEPRGYISSYSPDYIGKGFPSHFAWAASRQQRLQNQKSIQLSLTNVSLRSTKQGIFTVTFTQNYKSDTYKDVTNKRLDFKLIDGQWYIVAEKTLAKK